MPGAPNGCDGPGGAAADRREATMTDVRRCRPRTSSPTSPAAPVRGVSRAGAEQVPGGCRVDRRSAGRVLLRRPGRCGRTPRRDSVRHQSGRSGKRLSHLQRQFRRHRPPVAASSGVVEGSAPSASMPQIKDARFPASDALLLIAPVVWWIVGDGVRVDATRAPNNGANRQTPESWPGERSKITSPRPVPGPGPVQLVAEHTRLPITPFGSPGEPRCRSRRRVCGPP